MAVCYYYNCDENLPHLSSDLLLELFTNIAALTIKIIRRMTAIANIQMVHPNPPISYFTLHWSVGLIILASAGKWFSQKSISRSLYDECLEISRSILQQFLVSELKEYHVGYSALALRGKTLKNNSHKNNSIFIKLLHAIFPTVLRIELFKTCSILK